MIGVPSNFLKLPGMLPQTGEPQKASIDLQIGVTKGVTCSKNRKTSSALHEGRKRFSEQFLARTPLSQRAHVALEKLLGAKYAVSHLKKQAENHESSHVFSVGSTN